MKISIVVATTADGVIGNNNKLPWNIPEDLKHFKNITTEHCILMGRNTYESIGKPLPDRTSIVLSRNSEFKPEGVNVFTNLEDALKFAESRGENELMVIGGEEIYKQLLPKTTTIYQTLILGKFEGNIRFPEIDTETWQETSKEERFDLNPPIIFRNLERR